MNTIMRKLFLDGLCYDFKILKIETRELYSFIINNKHLLVEDVRDAKLTVSKEVIKDDFMQFANRDEIDDEVEIWFKRPNGVKKFPDNLIKAYYNDMQMYLTFWANKK